jgi:hypothetical protein
VQERRRVLPDLQIPRPAVRAYRFGAQGSAWRASQPHARRNTVVRRRAIDFWSLDYTARAGRGRRYHLALIDESAHDEGRLVDSFPASIAPALLDFNGSVVTASTPNGLDGWFHDIVHDQRHGFAVFHAPTGANPFLPVEAIAALRAELPRPEVALQELDAQFVDTGATIFPLAALLIDGEPHPDDFPCQAIGLAIDATAARAAPIATAARR